MEARGKQDRGGAAEEHFDAGLADADSDIGEHVVVKDLEGTARPVTIAARAGQVTVWGVRHEGEVQVGVDLGLDDGEERVHVEEVGGLGEDVLDHHAAGPAADGFSSEGVVPPDLRRDGPPP